MTSEGEGGLGEPLPRTPWWEVQQAKVLHGVLQLRADTPANLPGRLVICLAQLVGDLLPSKARGPFSHINL